MIYLWESYQLTYEIFYRHLVVIIIKSANFGKPAIPDYICIHMYVYGIKYIWFLVSDVITYITSDHKGVIIF